MLLYIYRPEDNVVSIGGLERVFNIMYNAFLKALEGSFAGVVKDL